MKRSLKESSFTVRIGPPKDVTQRLDNILSKLIKRLPGRRRSSKNPVNEMRQIVALHALKAFE